MHWMAPTLPWTVQCQRYPCMCPSGVRVPNFSPFRYNQQFLVTGHFETNMHRMTPKWLWTLQGQRYTIYLLLMSQSPKFDSVSLHDQPFFSYSPTRFERQEHHMTPKWTRTLQGERYPHIMYYLCPWVPNFTPICFKSIRLGDTMLLKIAKGFRLRLNTQRSNVPCIHIKYYPLVSKFWSVYIYDQPYSRYRIF